MTREEIIDFCEMKSQLEPENEDIFNYIVKALEPCEDAVSRQALIKHICEEKFCYKENCKGVLYNRCPDITWVNDLPSVQSTRKKGKWTFDDGYPDSLICNKCRAKFDIWHWEQKQMHYCPNCGAEMESEE